MTALSGFGGYVLHRCPHCGKQIGPKEASLDRTGEGWCRVCRDLRREVEQATRKHRRAHDMATLWDTRRRQCARNLTEASNRLRAMRDARLPEHLRKRSAA